MWMEPPGTRAAYPQRDQTILKCRMEDSSFLLSQVFNVLLIAVCTVYAVKTRKIPENFNESKFIGFTMYGRSLILLVVSLSLDESLWGQPLGESARLAFNHLSRCLLTQKKRYTTCIIWLAFLPIYFGTANTNEVSILDRFRPEQMKVVSSFSL